MSLVTYLNRDRTEDLGPLKSCSELSHYFHHNILNKAVGVTALGGGDGRVM